MTPALALTNAAILLASHADGTIQCPAQAETALAVALDPPASRRPYPGRHRPYAAGSVHG